MTTPSEPAKFQPGRMALIALLLCAIGAGVYLYFVYSSTTPPTDDHAALRGYLRERDHFGKLGEGLLDADGDLVADAPKDGKFLKPTTLVFNEVAGDNPDKLAEVWEPFRKALEAKTGLPVEFLKKDPNVRVAEDEPDPGMTYLQQMNLMKSGKLHLAAYSTGQVQMAVNVAGFVPMYAPATEAGEFSYHMEIIVPADSPIEDVKDLKGKKLAFVSLSSNSGAKAPLVCLKEKFGLNVGTDYSYTITGSHDISIQGVCVGDRAAATLANPKATPEAKAEAMKQPGSRYAAACVAGDILARLVASGAVKADRFRTIHKEGPFPSLCFGIPHNLSPDLVRKIEETFETFRFEGTTVGDKYKGAGRVKFVRVDYRKDWQVVREIDEKLPAVIPYK